MKHHNNINDKDFIIRLIKDDLIHTRLVSGLEALGLEAGQYYLRLHETILMLAGIEEDEDFDLEYLSKCDEVRNIEIPRQPEELHKLALTLYSMLVKRSREQKG